MSSDVISLSLSLFSLDRERDIGGEENHERARAERALDGVESEKRSGSERSREMEAARDSDNGDHWQGRRKRKREMVAMGFL